MNGAGQVETKMIFLCRSQRYSCGRFPKSCIAAVFLCWLLLPIAVTAADLGQIEALFDKGKNPQALNLLDEMLRQVPGHVSGRFLRARILFAEGQLQLAQRQLEDLLDEQTQYPEIYNNLAAIYARQGDFLMARKQLEQALSTHSGYQAVYENLVLVYERLASQAYHQALSPDEDLALPDIQLAVIGHLPEPVAVSSPVEQPVNTAPSVEDTKVIKAMVKAWARAWSSQQPEQYLSFYDNHFRPRAGLSREEWAAKRRVRLSKPKYIRVHVDNIDVMPLDERVATVFLRQHYESDRLNDTVKKNLVVRKMGNDWLIFQENLVR